MQKILTIGLLWTLSAAAFSQTAYQMDNMSTEFLNRGLVAMRQTEDSMSVSWRLLRDDPESVTFDLIAEGKTLAKNTSATYIKLSTKGFDFSRPITFTVRAHSKKGKVADALQEATYTLPADAPLGYIDIPLDKPEDGWFDLYTSYSYSANDCTVADVDGDGELEIILKWDPSNAHDNSHNGRTGNVVVDCYKISNGKPSDQKYLWRIDLGQNIRAGAHYTQIMAADLDGDGKAEIVMKTADGTIDGKGKVIGDSTAFWVNEFGHINAGPEYLTVFSGETGEALYTTDYVPERGAAGLWGDLKSNRSERYLACVAYLGNTSAKNGKLLPSVVMCRGYYTRVAIVAWDWDGRELKQRWFFDSYEGATLADKGTKWIVEKPGPWGDFSGQGDHSLAVADVDADGLDEIIYGSCTIDHNGKGLYSTKLGHGDAMHVTQFLPNDDRLYVWQCHEVHGTGSTLRNARTGEILFQIHYAGDCGRCMAADIDPTNPGVEMWSLCTDGIRNYKGELLANPQGLSYNMGVWWDGDTLRELLDKTTITKYDWTNKSIKTVTRFEGVHSNNGTKAVPALQGDLLGDWREEVLLPSLDNEHLYLFMTPYETSYRFTTLLQDVPYRHTLTVQNVGYNQPTQLSHPLK